MDYKYEWIDLKMFFFTIRFLDRILVKINKEWEIIREMGTLNSNIAGRTQRGYEDENKEKIKNQT